MDSNVLQELLLLGKSGDFKWDDLGKEVVYEMFPAGTEADVYRQVSGLDDAAKNRVLEIKLVTAVLKSVGGYNFGNKDEEKESFLRGMAPPTLNLFFEKFLQLRQKQIETFNEALKMIKKAPANPSPESSGTSSSGPMD